MENMDSHYQNWPKIPQMPQKCSVQFVCPSPKVWDFNEKRLHWTYVVRGLVQWLKSFFGVSFLFFVIEEMKLCLFFTKSGITFNTLIQLNKNDMVWAWKNVQTISGRRSTSDKWDFKPQISSIFHFYLLSDGGMDYVLGVKQLKYNFSRTLAPLFYG